MLDAANTLYAPMFCDPCDEKVRVVRDRRALRHHVHLLVPVVHPPAKPLFLPRQSSLDTRLPVLLDCENRNVPHLHSFASEHGDAAAAAHAHVPHLVVPAGAGCDRGHEGWGGAS